MASPADRIATAPSSWGLCEVPGWGVQLPPDRVLAEMRALGFHATEAGPDGYLGGSADEIRERLRRHELELVGGFLPLVLHDAAARADALATATRVAGHFHAAGATLLVSALVEDVDWSAPHALSPGEWSLACDGLARVDEIAAEAGLTHVVHPHWGTLVERDEDVQRVLEDSDVLLCLDTGHLVLGGADPAALAAAAPERVAHVHLKDVDGAVAARLQTGELGLVPAVQAGLYRPLGDGDAPIAGTVAALEQGGYDGWYVLEQDVSVRTPDPGPDEGPAEDVRRSRDHLARLLGA